MSLFYIPFLVWLSGQIFKYFSRITKKDLYNWADFVDMGGMPSTHSVLIGSFTAMIGIIEGFRSPLFAFSLIFAVFIIHDALRLRNIIQMQSKLLNHMRISMTQKEQSDFPYLSEKVGHTAKQVAVGLVWGVIGSIVLNRFL